MTGADAAILGDAGYIRTAHNAGHGGIDLNHGGRGSFGVSPHAAPEDRNDCAVIQDRPMEVLKVVTRVGTCLTGAVESTNGVHITELGTAKDAGFECRIRGGTFWEIDCLLNLGGQGGGESLADGSRRGVRTHGRVLFGRARFEINKRITEMDECDDSDFLWRLSGAIASAAEAGGRDGIGGGGAIMKSGLNIKSTATAASALSAAAMGASVGMDRFGMAVSLMVLNFVAPLWRGTNLSRSSVFGGGRHFCRSGGLIRPISARYAEGASLRV